MVHLPIQYKIISSIFSRVPFPILERLTKTSVIVPYYHIISDDEVLHVKHLYPCKNIKQFKNDLEFLLGKCSPVSLFDLIDFLKNGGPLPKKAFLLTFDDGFREMHDIVAHILSEKGISATFFVNSGFVDNKMLSHDHKASVLAEYFERIKLSGSMGLIQKFCSNHKMNINNFKNIILSIGCQRSEIIDEAAKLMNIDFDAYLSKYKPYLTSEQIRKLMKNGFTIGAHSIDHPFYSDLSIESQLHQTIESVRFVRESFSLAYGAFAFPYTDAGISREFFVKLYNTGLVDVCFGGDGMLDDYSLKKFRRFSLEIPLIHPKRIVALEFGKRLYKLRKARKSQNQGEGNFNTSVNEKCKLQRNA